LSKVEIVAKNQQFWSKIKILVKDQNCGQKSEFGQKSKLCSTIKILVKNLKFGQK